MTKRTWVVSFLLAVSLVFLIWLIATQQAALLNAWRNEDYFYFRNGAQAFLNGESPYATWRLPYPFYTILWLFTPLTLGDWTRWVWVFAPIVFLHLTLGRKAIILWLFYPALVHLRFGQVDGWLLMPIAFLINDKNNLGAIGMALILLKPQSAWALVAQRLLQWIHQSQWQKIAVLIGMAVVLVVPSFVIRPTWVGEWMSAITTYPWVSETFSSMGVQRFQQCQNATIWGWTCIGAIGIPFAIIEGMFAGILWWRARFVPAATFLLGMLVSPILFVYSYILVAPTLELWRECVALVLISWVAVAIDWGMGGWGGAYSIIPLAAMGFIANRKTLRSG